MSEDRNSEMVAVPRSVIADPSVWRNVDRL